MYIPSFIQTIKLLAEVIPVIAPLDKGLEVAHNIPRILPILDILANLDNILLYYILIFIHIRQYHISYHTESLMVYSEVCIINSISGKG